MNEPIRVGPNGETINDTWSNYMRKHTWVAEGRTYENGGTDGQRYYRLNVLCVRCHQIRKVIPEVMWETPQSPALKWGCPRIPLLYRLKLWLWNKPIPHWDVNTRPPWL